MFVSPSLSFWLGLGCHAPVTLCRVCSPSLARWALQPTGTYIQCSRASVRLIVHVRCQSHRDSLIAAVIGGLPTPGPPGAGAWLGQCRFSSIYLLFSLWRGDLDQGWCGVWVPARAPLVVGGH